MSETQVVCVGEVIIELARVGDGRFAMSCGGDTFNTAIYVARAGLRAAFATGLGDDPYSNGVLALASAEGVASDLVLRVPGRLPGLALVEADAKGKRHFHFWRAEAPARELFELPEWTRIVEGLLRTKLVYFSGITLSIYSNTGLGRFLAAVELARQQGVKIVFDGNFRAHGWRVDLALPTYDDEAVLWGDPSPEATVERLQAFGIGEIVVKNGPNSALVAAGGVSEFVPVPEVVEPVDPMAAGDGFNAGYIAARLSGDGPSTAAAAAHRLAGQVIR